MEKIKLPLENVGKLKEHQRTLHDLTVEFDRLEECGEDCSHYRAAIADAQAKVSKILENYS